MWWHHAADRCHTALLQPSVSLRHIMTSIPLPAIDPSAFKIAAQAGAMRATMPIHLRNLDSRAYRASNRSPAHMQGPIAQAASAQKMFLTRSATDVLQGLPA